MILTKSEFEDMYPTLGYDHFNNPPPAGTSKAAFESRYLSSKLWRLNNLYTIVNKDGNAVKFVMNKSQHIVYVASKKHPRVIVLKSRQQGISTFWLVSFFDDCIFGKHLSIGLMAQGTDEATTLLERVKFLWDNLSEDVKTFTKVKLIKDNTKEYGFSNNCTMFVRVSFRSATLQRLHISEFGKIANANPQRAKETKTGTLQTLAKGNTGIIESTAEGRNDFSEMWDNAVLAHESGQMAPKDFYPVFLSWLYDPDCTLDVFQSEDNESKAYFSELEIKTGRVINLEQRNFWIAQRRELAGDIYQEYPATPEEAFAVSKDGTYYARKFNEDCVRKGGVISDLYDPNLDTDIYFDIGVHDYCVMGWVQWYRGKYRIVAEYWNNNFDLEYYIDVAIELGWPIRSFVFPHDVKVRQAAGGKAQGGLARTRLTIVREYVKSKKLRSTCRAMAKISKADGREAVRRMIPNMMIDPKCTYLIRCFNNYSKEWDAKLKVWKDDHLHDEYSHGADMLRQIATDHKETGLTSMALPEPRKPSSGFAV